VVAAIRLRLPVRVAVAHGEPFTKGVHMRGLTAGLVTVAVTFIAAGIVFQVVRPQSQGPVITGQAKDAVVSLSHDLFKG
jgi:hypothetical protein